MRFSRPPGDWPDPQCSGEFQVSLPLLSIVPLSLLGSTGALVVGRHEVRAVSRQVKAHSLVSEAGIRLLPSGFPNRLLTACGQAAKLVGCLGLGCP